MSAPGALARLVLAILLSAPPARAQARGDADSTITLDPALEDALEAAEGETGLVLEDTGAGLGEGNAGGAGRAKAGAGARGRWRAAGGGRALSLALRAPGGRFALAVLLAREPGETRLVDDRALRLSWRALDWLSVSVGRVAPEIGAGLVLGAPTVRMRAPGRLAGGVPFAQTPLPAASPARAASGDEGVWLTAQRGGWRLGLLAADTRRDARRVGEAWLPVAGVRHRTAREDSARGALGERGLAIALARGPAWLVIASGRSDVRRVPPPGASAAEQRASRVVDHGAGFELGARWGPATWNAGARLEVALALDARGRTRSAVVGEFAPRGAGARAALLLETEATDFTPWRARPERRPHAHMGVIARGPLGAAPAGHEAWTWRLEAHVLERRAYESARLGSSLRASAPGGGWIELGKGASPERTLLAFRAPACGGRLSVAGELRFDRHGLARELWRIRVASPAPGGLAVTGEASLGAGRVAFGELDPDVPGGAWVASGAASERVHLACARPGQVTPSVAWLSTRSAAGTRSEVRLGLEWSVGDTPSSEEETRP